MLQTSYQMLLSVQKTQRRNVKKQQLSAVGDSLSADEGQLNQKNSKLQMKKLIGSTAQRTTR